MKNNPVFSWIGTALSSMFAYLSAVELKDLVSWILSIVTAVVTIVFTIWSWYKKATKDGNITKNEIDELVDQIKDKTKEVHKDD